MTTEVDRLFMASTSIDSLPIDTGRVTIDVSVVVPVYNEEAVLRG